MQQHHFVTNSRRKVRTNYDRVLQASSPDEIALLQFGDSLGYILEHKDIKTIQLKLPDQTTEQYTVLENFPFSAERKRMGLLIRDENQGQIHLLLKGADSIIIPMVDQGTASFIKQNCDHLAKQGLRTLVMCSKILKEEEYKAWKAKFEEAGKDLEHREVKENEVIEELESGIQLLGISGVEDILQDNIGEIIQKLREAGIRVWMLTGIDLLTKAIN